MRAKGIDISHWQISFKDKKNTDFVILKATEGYGWTDPNFLNYLDEAHKVPIRGAYHYFRTEFDPTMQAEHFYNTTKHKGLHFLAVDYEKTNNILDKNGAKVVRERFPWLFDVRVDSRSTGVMLEDADDVTREEAYEMAGGWAGKLGESVKLGFFLPATDELVNLVTVKKPRN